MSRSLGGGETEETPCDIKRRQAKELWTRAVACTVDSDCNHYPSTCTAIADNQAADELFELERWMKVNCNSEREVFCGSTTPVCEDGACTVRKLPSLLDP